MTKLPTEAQRISYVPETERTALRVYDLPEVCAHPLCSEPMEHAHHIVRRSYTQGKGPQDWIAIDGRPMVNKVGLCLPHHEQLTDNTASILYYFEQWYWNEPGYPDLLALLDPVPLGRGVWRAPEVSYPQAGLADAADAPTEREHEREETQPQPSRDSLPSEPRRRSTASHSSSRSTTPAQETAPSPSTPLDHGAVSNPEALKEPESDKGPPVPARTSGSLSAPDAICPTCGRKKLKPKEKLEKARPRVKWGLHVPKDHQEDGAELIDQAIEAARMRIGRPEGTPPYFTLIDSLSYVAYIASEDELEGLKETA